MNIYLILLIMIGNIILESTIVNRFAIFSVVPNITLVLIIIIALSRGRKLGSFVGLISGLIIDILFSPAIGINGLLYFFLGYIVGLLDTKISKDNILIPLLLSLSGTFLYNLFYLLFMFFLGYNINFNLLFNYKLIIEIIYNSILMVPLFKILSKRFIIKGMSFSKR